MELQQLIKGTQRITFSDGWSLAPEIYYATPHQAMDSLLARSGSAQFALIEADEDAQQKAERREEARRRNRERAEQARRKALTALGDWHPPGV
ncbi:MAG: hypothetical protein LAT68_17125 [Cyclobacteriaceae bacterium]|nr:hypothetical protein [Cyclobacteriaceae bacterium]